MTSTTPPSPVRRYKVAEEEMLDAACEVFAAEGFDRARMETIAARAGTTKPTLYARLGSKENLFTAAVRREHELLSARLFAAYDAETDEPFHRSLRRWNAAYFDFVRERPDGFRLSSEGERYPVAAAIIERATNERIDRIAELVVSFSGRRTGPGARLVAAMIVGTVRACADRAIRLGEIDLDEASALCHSFLYDALRGLDLDLLDGMGRR